MVWLIAVVPAVFVYIVIAASKSRKVWAWASLIGVCFAFLGVSTYVFLDVFSMLIASFLAWHTVDFKVPERADSRVEPANWDGPRQTRHEIASAFVARESEAAFDDTLEPRYRVPPAEHELAWLRAKINDEFKANAAQREREARWAANRKSGESS